MAVLVSVLRGHIDLDDRVLCLSGVAASGRLDALVLLRPRRDFPWFRKHRLETIREAFPPDLFLRVLQVGMRFSAEGREGRPIGTLFILGDLERAKPYARQLILNPCQGHPRESRSMFREEFLETLRELTGLDGAILVDREGVVETAGTYIDAPTEGVELPAGLGARHMAGAAVSAQTNVMAIALSESSGTLSVFHDGEIVLHLERARRSPSRKSPREQGRPEVPRS
jgi:DNA integrity scanning protein DisA with diadenylate cyclase activity